MLSHHLIDTSYGARKDSLLEAQDLLADLAVIRRHISLNMSRSKGRVNQIQ